MEDKINIYLSDELIQEAIRLLHDKAKGVPDFGLTRTEHYNKYMIMASTVTIARSIGMRNKDKIYCSRCKVKSCDRKAKKVIAVQSKMNAEVKDEVTFTKNSFKINQ